jgi:DNA repair protein RecN (Recombination protein N)
MVMLEELLIRDLGVIEEVALELAPGLNVLTGETGAGKTMVVSALELLLGARADADQVRAGAGSALVEGRLRPPPAAAGEWLGDGDDELIVSREVSAGRSRARLGGRMAPASALGEVVGASVEVHGQSDTVRLAAPTTQRDLLDRSGGAPLAERRDVYAQAYEGWRAAAAELETLRGSERDRAREADRLAFEVAEIDGVAPVAGEEDSLDAELRRLEHAEALVGAASTAAAALTGEGAARDALGGGVAALRAVAGVDDELEALRKRIEGLAVEAQELGLDLSAYAEGLEVDPLRLEQLRARRAALGGLTRKYGPDSAAVVAYADEARIRLAQLRGGDERADALAVQVDALRARVDDHAAALSAARRAAGERLAAAVHTHLADLAMPAARLTVAVEAAEPGPTGADRVSFLLAANEGEPSLPLGKAASGGERSRLALALRLALADADDTAVLVFDEVDAGVGGAVALDLARKLARLARGRQVLCVTHLAQLAAFADAHFVVAKGTAAGRTSATVRRLDDAERVTELSRLLSGTPDSARAAAHAAELRDLARRDGAGED